MRRGNLLMGICGIQSFYQPVVNRCLTGDSCTKMGKEEVSGEDRALVRGRCTDMLTGNPAASMEAW